MYFCAELTRLSARTSPHVLMAKHVVSFTQDNTDAALNLM